MTDAEMRAILEPRVDKGIAFLDEKVPGWRDKINRETLEVYSPCSCIIGQLYSGHYCQGLTQLGIPAEGQHAEEYLGFDIECDQGPISLHRSHGYAVLTQIWKDKLQRKGEQHGTAQ